MPGNPVISLRQFVISVTLFSLGSAILYVPGVLSIVMRDIGDFVTIEMLKFTPIEIIELSFTFILIVGGYFWSCS
ncbi:hypothetical protein [Paenibacillus elgii]|uniref:hypothetical protein n=1 Tax=Paenibacillus elgii TaxID=189691 RepID=UPI00203F5AAE|nr:hypothetical protein [Paenibacillus elgii]MCM3271240.1 hypothetical protein [Paenibacillus elgii]